MMDADALKAVIDRLGPWHHSIEFVPGIRTHPEFPDHPESRWGTIEPHIPKDLRGKSVLDVGSNSGFFSVKMKQRGADRVVGIDMMPHLIEQGKFLSHWFSQDIDFRLMDVYGDVESLGKFDLVLFMGVLYHLKHPLYALEKLAQVCKDTMIVQSVTRGSPDEFEMKEDYPADEWTVFDEPGWPKMYFIPKKVNGDVSNWWFPNLSCLKAMIRDCGFKNIIPTKDPATLICRR